MAITTAQRNEIITLFVGVFNAAPGAEYLTQLVNARDAGATLSDLANALVAHPEFNKVHPNFQTSEEFASALVANLLGSEVEPAAAEWSTNWVASQINAGATKAEVIVAALTAIATTDNPEYADAQAALANKVEVATYYSVNANLSSNDLVTLQDVIANVTSDEETVEDAVEDINETADNATGNLFTLTIGEDSGATFVGGNGSDTFNAPIVQNNAGNPIVSLESFDSLDGGAGTDTLNVTLAGAAAPAPVLKNIENVNVRFTGSDTLNLANTTGVTTVTAGSSTTIGTVSNVGAIANLAVASQTQNVTFTGNTAKSQGLSFNAVTNTTTLDTGATSLNVTTNASTVTIAGLASAETLSIAATGANKLDLSATAGAVKTATVTGEGTVNVSAVTLAALTTLTATANTGGVTAKVDDTAVTINTGAGKDSITYTAAIAATAKVNLGAGDDTFAIAAATGAGATVAGGEGTDTLVVTNGAWLDAAAAKVYSGFETLGIAGGTGTYNMDNLPGLTAVSLAATALAGAATISNAVAGTTVSVASKAGTDLAAGTLTYALKDATGTSDAATLTLSAADTGSNGTAEGQVTVASYTAADIETVNIVSNITGVDALLKNTDYTNTITALVIDDATTLNVSGSANLEVTGVTATALTKVDASTMTGGLAIDVSAVGQAVEFLGSAAADEYTSTLAGDTINAGAGADVITLDGTNAASDTLIFEAGDSVLNAAANGHDVINDFGTAVGAGALDIIDLGAFGFSGQQSSALASKGALAATVVDGTVLSQTDFFLSGGVDRGVAIGTEGGDTWVFVDINEDGNFTAADDLVIQLVGVTDVSLNNFGF